MERILVIDNEPEAQGLLVDFLESANYEVELTGDGKIGLDCFQSFLPHAVILDLRRPGVSGREILSEIKRQSRSTPVIVLSAISNVADKILLLELGADDYLTKPFSPRELLARLQGALRRQNRWPSGPIFAFDDVLIEFSTKTVSRNGESVPVTPREFELLSFLVANHSCVFTRKELLHRVWKYRFFTFTRTVDAHFVRLRHKLEKDPGSPGHFLTLNRIGYKFVP